MRIDKTLLKEIEPNLWEYPKQGEMRVPARVYSNRKMIDHIFSDKAMDQLLNVATMPGIVGYSLAMADIHRGFGFPIGGVAAFDLNSGVISPGGVGYDINCGVRMMRTNLFENDIKDAIKQLVNAIAGSVPSGVGSSDAIFTLNSKQLSEVLVKGSRWAVENGFGEMSDLEHTEENGGMKGANPDMVSKRAYQRGSSQLGTLGSGNHFIEIGAVTQIFNPAAAKVFDLYKGQIIVMVHCGSRGLGHQICEDYVKSMQREIKIPLSDRQLSCAPLQSKLGRMYFAAMAGAANYAWANRQIIMSLVEKSMMKTMSLNKKELGFALLYDVCHNIAKFETHKFRGREMNLCVHRKGATRAFAPGHSAVPADYKGIGQPVIIPGDMGRYSYLCLGTQKAMNDTFGSSSHGAGRVMSRRAAKKTSDINAVRNELRQKGIYVRAASNSTLVEEMSMAYKSASDVVDVMEENGVLKPVLQTKPIGVVKG
jgi:tRNA-splicing ligase RtcB